VTLSMFDIPKEHMSPVVKGDLKTQTDRGLASENCGRIKDLGFATSQHITMYGEHFELVSDPFAEGDCTAVRVIKANDPTVRTLRLPVAILVGPRERFRNPTKSIGHGT
jgi:hypothetical protein